jgi:hypothetical protein
MRRVLWTADLLRGEAMSVSWEPFTAHVRPGTLTSDLPMTMLLYHELNISIGSIDVNLGYLQVHLPAARMDISSTTEHENHRDMRIVPVGGTEAVARYKPHLPD